MPIKVCLAGATGWAGSELARGIAGTDDLTLVAAVSRKHAGRTLGQVLGEPRLTCLVFPSAADACAGACDVFVEYTRPGCAKANILAALEQEARGATLSGSQVHSVRLPGFVISAEIIFGMPDQKLTPHRS